MRIALGLEYHGGGFQGWQRQKQAITVQQTVETALSEVANHKVTVICAGRTDTAVHATHQVIHFDTQSERLERAWVLGANSNMPERISVLWARHVSCEFHARFKAQARAYRYIILNRRSRPALLGQNVTWCRRPLSAENMHTAAGALLGRHDFSGFRAKHCQSKSPVKTIQQLSVTRKDDYLYLDIKADGFLYHMVRNIAGVLIAIGQGDAPVSWAEEVLKKADRAQGGVTAAPYGLYLTNVEYPDEFELPKPQTLPVFS